MKRVLMLLPALLAVIAGGCAREQRLNVLLVTIDTARADRFGCYGYAEPSSPNIDALAAEGALFTHAFATNPITLPSHTSIMTGTYPVFHGVRDNSTYMVRESVTTLAEILKGAGYQTSAIIGAFVLDSRFGLDQGFTDYDDRIAADWSKDEIETREANSFGFEERKAHLVTASALEWLRKPHGSPFFLWLHYFDPHQPINPPEPYHSRFNEPYAGEIALADEQLNHVLDELKKQKIYDRTLIVILADHGEGLMEHGEPTHSLLVFDAVMRVPLIFRMPGEPAGLRQDQLASTVDVLPTVLDLLGLETPPEVQGRTLAPLVRGQDMAVAPRSIYMETLVPTLQCGWGSLRAVRTADEKLIHGPRPRLYRVGEDPGELYNLADREPEAVQRLTAELENCLNLWSSPDAAASISATDEETMAKLASLGYIVKVGRGSDPGAGGLKDVIGKDDPHDMRWLFDMIGVATENLRMGYEREGVLQLQQVLAGDPDNPAALTAMGKAYLKLRMDPRVAEGYFEKCVAADPMQEEAHFYLSRILRARGDLEGARHHAEKILEFQPDAVAALSELGKIYESMDQPVRAREHLRHVLEIDRNNVGALVALGLSHGRRGESKEAGEYFKRAVEIAPESPGVLYNQGIWFLQNENVEAAISTMARLVSLDPNLPDAQFILGKLLYERGDLARARETLLLARRLPQRAEWVAEIDSMLLSIERTSPPRAGQ